MESIERITFQNVELIHFVIHILTAKSFWILY